MKVKVECERTENSNRLEMINSKKIFVILLYLSRCRSPSLPILSSYKVYYYFNTLVNCDQNVET